MHISCTATKTISLELDAYERLKAAKGLGESFSENNRGGAGAWTASRFRGRLTISQRISSRILRFARGRGRCRPIVCCCIQQKWHPAAHYTGQYSGNRIPLRLIRHGEEITQKAAKDTEIGFSHSAGPLVILFVTLAVFCAVPWRSFTP